MTKNKHIACYLCGKNPAKTADHVPPKNLFPKDYKVKGYKLPACESCNNPYSKDEEYIRDCFSLIGQNNAAHQVFRQGTRESYLRPYTLLQTVTKLDRLKKSLTKVDIKSKGGIYLGTATGIKIIPERLVRVAIKITKGLFFHFSGNRIPDDYSFDFYFQPPNILPEMLKKPSSFIGAFGDVFSYKGLLTKQDSNTGILWMSFYRSIAAIVVVESPSVAQEIATDRESKPKIRLV